jgi:hypothetical protein
MVTTQKRDDYDSWTRVRGGYHALNIPWRSGKLNSNALAGWVAIGILQ